MIKFIAVLTLIVPSVMLAGLCEAYAADTCTKTTTFESGPNGTTIIKTHKVCEVGK